MDNPTTPQLAISLGQSADEEEKKIKHDIRKLKKAIRKRLGKHIKLEAA